jgi:hypothetical protein
MLMMVVTVYEDVGVRYNPQWMGRPPTEDDHFFADSRDVLLHGLVSGRRMGTCSSMPVLYIALARRLGYPVKLVSTKGHLFIRWDSAGDRFAIEATAKGMDRREDAYYRQWPHPVSDEEVKAEGYFKSFTAAEELSVFLTMRAFCLREAGRLQEAVAAHAAAHRLVPEWRGNQFLMGEAQEQLVGASATALLQAQPVFNSHQEEVEFVVRRAEALSRLKRAELGIPEPRPPMPNPFGNPQ